MKYVLSVLLVFNYLVVSAQSGVYTWFTDKAEAIVYANDHEADILMVFAGSDWCRPCKQFKNDILEAADFKSYADGNLVILYLDFPSKKKSKLSKEATLHNEALAEQYNTSGTFPKIILLDKDLNKIKDLSYNGQSAEEFVAMLK